MEQQKSLAVLIKSDSIQNRFKEVLGQKAPGFISSIISVSNSNAALKNADPTSVIAAAMMAATLDLPINPNLGYAYIIPYGNKAQFQIGYKGVVQLAIRTGLYKTINVTEVYDGQLLTNNKLTGEITFDWNTKKSDTVIGFAAYFELLTGFSKMLYMSVAELEKHGKKYSKTYNNKEGRWSVDFDGMAKKTVLKMLLSKWGILSIEMQRAIQADQATIKDTGEVDEYIDNADFVEAEKIEDDPNSELKQGAENVILNLQISETVKRKATQDVWKCNTPEEINKIVNSLTNVAK